MNQPDNRYFQEFWHGKRYYSLDAYMKNRFGKKIGKIALDEGFTCPNRDGTLDSRGCTFCSPQGSGDFAVPLSQIVTAEPYIAYFQAFTCTYGPIHRLRLLYEKALSDPLAIGISIATRPDCLGDEVLHLLSFLADKYKEKLIWIELGLQTIHEKTAAAIRRGYSLPCFTKAVRDLHHINIPVIVHVILGLPGETFSMMHQTVEYLNDQHIFGIKFQLLHVLEGTDMGKDYENGLFEVLSTEDYLTVLTDCIGRLSPEVVIHRVTGDGPGKILLAPTWSRNKKKVLNELHHKMKINNIYQGKYRKGSFECHKNLLPYTN